MERIAMFLIGLRDRAAASGVNDGVFSLVMRRSDIADLLGLTIETVSRTLTKLRGMRVIDDKSQRVAMEHKRAFEVRSVALDPQQFLDAVAHGRCAPRRLIQIAYSDCDAHRKRRL